VHGGVEERGSFPKRERMRFCNNDFNGLVQCHVESVKKKNEKQ